ncbi:hypothetical protein ILUMI_01010 [Ignelater luminosus]|uniref:Uncharacterized protein n=1 Tax=Ignelater luminosus TaxID=2038154 RepID=A0A8K0DJB4_IGNLU|nr:hypothetical protein ILUMI_01010 [Ignelater luminosus]
MDNVTTVTTINLNKVCRVCLMEYEEMHSIFSEIQNEDNLEEESTFLCEILMNISSIRVLADDGLPSMICTSCMELAHTSYKFQQQCNRSQEILEAYILQLQAKDFDEEAQCNKETPEEVLEYLHSNLSPTNDETNELLQVAVESVVDEVKELESNCTNDKDCLDDSLGLSSDSNFPDSSCVNPENVLIKTEVKDEPILDAAKVAASEDNVRLRQRLAIKRMKAEGNSKKGGQPAIGFSYYLKMNETGEKLYECNYCGKMYKHANSLKIHIRTHTLERPYVCSHCGKGFKQYGALSYHLRSHTGEQPYACKICGKRYRQSGTLTAHMRVHTGQKPFLCSVCGRGFRECNKAFPSSTRLKRHAIIHTGLKPYTCEVCSKSFNRLSSLRVHAKIHTDERPHVCSICGKGFIQAHALRGHMHTHSSADDVGKAS